MFSTATLSTTIPPGSLRCWPISMRPGTRSRRLGSVAIGNRVRRNIYAKAKRVIINYGMGITQHRHGTGNVQQIAILMLRGNIGREGAGRLLPYAAGHSNAGRPHGRHYRVPNDELLDVDCPRVRSEPPRHKGHNVEAVEAIRDGRSKALVCLAATSPLRCRIRKSRSRRWETSISRCISPPNSIARICWSRSNPFIPPLSGRTETDMQATSRQSVTVEDLMSMVHAPRGGLKPASEHLRSEPAIIGGIALATLLDTAGSNGSTWSPTMQRYAMRSRRYFRTLRDFNACIKRPGGFRPYVAASSREWRTATGKANFIVYPGVDEDPRAADRQALTSTTIRSHDQYNTTIYGLNDRYRESRVAVMSYLGQ